MSSYASISINNANVYHTYDYAIPEELADEASVGALVQVPFGKQVVQGVLIALKDEPEVSNPLKIQAVLSAGTLLCSQQLALAEWLSRACFASLGACINLMIPDGLSQRASMEVWLDETAHSLLRLQEAKRNLPESQHRLLHLLDKRGKLRAGQIDRALPRLNWRKALRELQTQGFVHSRNFLPPPGISPKTVRTAQLSVPPDPLPSLERSSKRQSETVLSRRNAVLRLLASDPFPVDFSWIYAQTGATYTDLKALVEAGLVHFNETEVWRDPLEDIRPQASQAPQLTTDQAKVWQALEPRLLKPDQKPQLLFGVTGSGKTEIYMRAVTKALEAGKQTLVLVPEISMTPQAVRRFMARFPNRVGLFHHKLSEGERYDTWRRACSGELKVIVGSRSALFLPMPELGLIVIDECDNDSYDEEQREPFYHAPETAEALARISGASLILGSATPRITQFRKAETGAYELLELPHRIDTQSPQDRTAVLPQVEIVDMRTELKHGNTSVFSESLKRDLNETLARGEQAILFLNRKGSATYVFCRNCGIPLLCPHDGKALVYYASKDKLVCQVCGYSRKMPKLCPNCKSKTIRALGLGTEKLEALVHEIFPAARTLRWDADSASTKGAHDLILSHFSAHRADILIGTQMLAKGLDLPQVTFVGILLAEVGLNLPDYRAGERTFQILTQVSGRAGRGPLGGKVVMQTYQPENPVIQFASQHDFCSFYQHELKTRRELAYPPFTRLTKLEFRHLREQKAIEVAKDLHCIIENEISTHNLKNISISAPLPAYYPRLGGEYCYQMLLRAENPLSLLKNLPLRGWRVEIDPSDLL